VPEGQGEQDETRSGAAASRSSAREDFFVRSLGEEWVEVEPGIYKHIPRGQNPPTPKASEPELDDALIDRLLSPLDRESGEHDSRVGEHQRTN
jgi:hypothetical protein